MTRLVLLVGVALLLPCAAIAQTGPGGGGPDGGRRGGGRGGPPGGRRGAESVAGPKPLKREKFDRVVTTMFRSADTNRDGIVTLDEFRAVIDRRLEAAIRARFARVDRNRDGRIDPDEFFAWQRGMGSVALSEASAVGADGASLIPEVIEPALGDGSDERLLARLVEPLGATVLAAANVNYDTGVTLDELLTYEHKRFDAADVNHDGELTPDETRDLFGSDGRRGIDGSFGGRRRLPDNGDPADRDR